jgi:hypothetical protein
VPIFNALLFDTMLAQLRDRVQRHCIFIQWAAGLDRGLAEILERQAALADLKNSRRCQLLMPDPHEEISSRSAGMPRPHTGAPCG